MQQINDVTVPPESDWVQLPLGIVGLGQLDHKDCRFSLRTIEPTSGIKGIRFVEMVRVEANQQVWVKNYSNEPAELYLMDA